MTTIISIIIPVYNAEKYIKDCIESVFEQTIEEYEVICVDDGSTDGSVDIISDYAQKDERVHLYKQEHKGAGAARNYGIKHASGRYVAFLDADDMYVEKDALFNLVNICEEKHVPLCASSYVVDLINGQRFKRSIFEELEIDSCGRAIKFEEYQNDFNYTAFIYERAYLLRNGFFFPDYRRYQDPVFLLKIIVDSKEFWALPVTLYMYRQSASSKNKLLEHSEDVLSAIKENVLIAVKYDYYTLYKRLIGRIFDWYCSDGLIEELPSKTKSVLVEIEAISNNYSKGVMLLEILSNNHRFLREIQSDRDLFKKIIKGQSRGFFADYFCKNNIKEVCVYGIGVYGKLLIEILLSEGIKINSIVDKKVNRYKNYRILDDVNKISENEVIMISLKEPSEIKEKIILTHKKVITFREMIDLVEC